MRIRSQFVWTLVSIFIFVLVASSAYAQPPTRKVNGVFGAGYTAPNSEVRDHLGDGFNVNIGFQINATPTIGIEGLYSFNGLGQKQIVLPVVPQPLDGSGVPTDFFADMNMQYGTAALVAQRPMGVVRPYGIVGGGIYYRPVKVTTPGVGYVPGYCDPWWYICYPGGFVPVENIVGERSSTDFGMVFGGGVNFSVAFAEVRYHYIWGPTIEIAPGFGEIAPTSRDSDGQFLQVTFGLRF